jgi:hypothetical protein
MFYSYERNETTLKGVTYALGVFQDLLAKTEGRYVAGSMALYFT